MVCDTTHRWKVYSERSCDMKIDFVIPWVDGNDPLWKKERMLYSSDKISDASAARYRDMGILKYWFRAVEAYAPWVNRIHFVTWGHLPDWLNTEHPKLHIVNHKDYIPEKYLPTFSSHPIELNLHRIPGLSEHFVYFNDDMFLNAPVTSDFFFYKGLPCDFANIDNLYSEGPDDVFSHILYNESHFTSKHYSYLGAFWKHPFKYLNAVYPWKANLKNLLKLENRRYFPGFIDHHLATPYLKQTFVNLWKKDSKILDQVSKAKFRTPFDVSQRVFRYAQLASGQFCPVSPSSRGRYLNFSYPIDFVEATLNDPQINMVCINDIPSDAAFEEAMEQIVAAYEKKLPNKSSFEK